MITFGSRVFGSTQNRLKQLLEIPNQGGGGKYLGLPEQFGRKKREMFDYILDRVRKRTASWSAKFLSPAGKEVMLKSVALAMPVYAMSCFKLPLGIISDIESLLMQFWWEKSAQKKGIPWIAWKRLQYSKKEGGLGFRDLAKFNDALLAKQAWRLLEYPQSLFARLMKARYYKDTSLLEAKARRSQSYGWSSLLSGIDLLKKGTRFIVGNGNSIRIGQDNVLPLHPPRPIRVSDSCLGQPLSSFIAVNGSHRSWNYNLISSHIDLDDQAYVSRIHLPRCAPQDTMVWHYTKSGVYTVRSGYWFLTHDPNQRDPPPPLPYGSVELKNKIWKLPILPKIKHFLWRALSRSLATMARLITRGVVVDPICPRCGREEETINHALFTCPFALMVWRLSNSRLIDPSSLSEDFDTNLATFFNSHQRQNLGLDLLMLPFWLLWRIWKGRNNFVFNNIRESATSIVLKAQAETAEWLLAFSRHSRQTHHVHSVPHRVVWRRPPDSYVKCNFDASFDGGTLQAVGGWIVRDHEGISKCWGASDLGGANSPLEAEAKALLVALQQCWIRGYKKIIFEGDSESLIHILHGSLKDVSLTGLLHDIYFWAAKFITLQFLFTKREGNVSAHLLARHGCLLESFFSDSVNPPLWLEQQLCTDLSS